MKSTVILILKKWWFKTLTFCLILSAVSILASGQRDSQTKNSIVKMNEKFMEEFKSADAQRLAEFYAADAQLLPSGAPSIIGKEHILGYWQMGMKAGIKDFVLQTVEAEEYGDKIIEQGTYAIYAGEDFIVDKGKYIVIWKKEAGKLKISRDIFNSDNPPPPPAPRAIEKDTMLIIYNYIKPEMIEEERRLLYVAMTRAKQSLSLISPLRYHVTQQKRDGDKHVYGARSRFMTEPLLLTMEKRFEGRPEASAGRFSMRTDKQIDVAARLREMW